MTAAGPVLRIVRDGTPEAAELLRDGWSVVAESWGARLHVNGERDPVLRRCSGLVARAEQRGWSLREAGGDDAEAVVALDAASVADYPETPQNAHEVPDASALAADLDAGRAWAFVAVSAGGDLDAATILRAEERHPAGPLVDTDFTVVRSTARRRGLASGVKAAAVLGLFERGHSLFGTGGAAANTGSVAANEAVGYEITERWLNLTPPVEDSALD